MTQSIDSAAFLAQLQALRGGVQAAGGPTVAALREREDSYREASKFTKPAYGEQLQDQFRGWLEKVIVHDQSRGLRADSWQNMLTGHGTARDKTTFTMFQQDNQLDFPTLEALYHNEDLAARIVDAVPEQMFREGFEVQVEDDAEASEGIEQQLHELAATEVLEETAIWARLYGGGAAFVGAQDGREPQEALSEKTVRAVTFLQVIDRFSLWPNTWYSDPDKPKFGMPETYRIFTPTVAGVTPPVNVIIHESRLITFPGARTSIRKRRVNFGWEDSVLQRPNQVLQQFGLSWAAATHLLSDAAQGVYKVKNLLDMIAGQNKEALMDRMAVVDQTRSTARMLLVDAENEDFTRTPTPFAGVAEMLDRSMQRLAAAARMPVTVLMGMAPAGLNATGESDIRQWYDQIRTLQHHVAKPRVKRLATILMLAKEGPTGGDVPNFGVHFKPLWQPTALEESQRRLAGAQADDIYLGYGVTLPEEVRESRFGGDGYSPETTVDGDLTDEALTAVATAASAVKGQQPGQVNQDPNAAQPQPGTNVGTLGMPNVPARDPAPNVRPKVKKP